MNRPEIFRGDSARQYFAERTNQKSGQAFETTYEGPSLSNLIWQLSPFLALGLVLLAAFGRGK